MQTRHLIPSLAGAAMITTCCAVSAAHGGPLWPALATPRPFMTPGECPFRPLCPRLMRGCCGAPHPGLLRRSVCDRRDRSALLDRLCRALGPQLWSAGAGAVVSFRVDPARLSYLVAERPALGHHRHAALRCRAAFGDRRAPRVLASADTDGALLHYRRGDLLADPAARSIQPAQAHIARHAGRHRSRAALPGTLGHRATPVARLIRWPHPAC